MTEGAKQAAGNAQAQAAARISGRLRWNNILNQVTRRGTAMGNSAGVLGKWRSCAGSCFRFCAGPCFDGRAEAFCPLRAAHPSTLAVA